MVKFEHVGQEHDVGRENWLPQVVTEALLAACAVAVLPFTILALLPGSLGRFDRPGQWAG